MPESRTIELTADEHLPGNTQRVGMALVAGEAFPAWAEEIMALTIASTVVFELAGPALAIYAIRRVSRQSQ